MMVKARRLAMHTVLNDIRIMSLIKTSLKNVRKIAFLPKLVFILISLAHFCSLFVLCVILLSLANITNTFLFFALAFTLDLFIVGILLIIGFTLYLSSKNKLFFWLIYFIFTILISWVFLFIILPWGGV